MFSLDVQKPKDEMEPAAKKSDDFDIAVRELKYEMKGQVSLS